MKKKSSPAICLTHIGKRPNHEDNFFFNGLHLTSEMQKQMSNHLFFSIRGSSTAKICLFAISDGMGGHNAGEVASQLCVEKLTELEKMVQNCSSIKDVVNYAQSNIAEINTIVCKMSDTYEELKGMGTTLVLFIIFGTDYAVLNVGDSRAYYFNTNTLVQITKDNTEGQRMLDLGLLTRKELDSFPARKNLNHYIGYTQNGFVFRADEYYPVLENGIILLCSDGVSDSLSDNQIRNILQSESDIESAGKRLIEESIAGNHADNATAILIPLRR